jgi:hypothetical protein
MEVGGSRDKHDFGTAAWECGGRLHDRSQAQRVYGRCLRPDTGADSSDRASLGGFGLLASIAITFACITVSQMAYLLLLWLSSRHEDVLADKPPHNQGRQNGQGKIPNKHTQQKRPPSHLTT